MAKSFDIFINFNGDCRKAVEFYAKVFGSEAQGLCTYDDAPPSEGYVLPEADRGKIMYCRVPIFGCNVMLCDVPEGMPFIVGNNISPTLGTNDADEIRRLFDELKQGGEVGMELQKTFWSGLYGMVTDKFGIIWQLTLTE